MFGQILEISHTYLEVAAARVSKIIAGFERTAEKAYEKTVEQERKEHQYGQFGKPKTEEILGDTVPIIHHPEGPVDVRTGKDPTRVEYLSLEDLKKRFPEDVWSARLREALDQGWISAGPITDQQSAKDSEEKGGVIEGAKDAFHDFGKGLKKAGEDFSEGLENFMRRREEK